MARRSKPQTPVPANLSVQQMADALPKLERRIKELDAFDPDSVQDRSDPRIDALSQKIDALFTDVFGSGTIEYDRYQHKATHLDTAGYNYAVGTSIQEVREGLHEGKANALSTLNTIKELFAEAIEDAGMGGPTTRALRAYQGLELHPEIERAAGQLFADSHFSNAIEDAVKALNDFVRLRSGVADKDGVSLMQNVFSPTNPILKFNALADESDRNEQLGFMKMFEGAVSGLRNPRAHRLMKDDAERALEFIAFISLLAKLVDSAKK